MESPVSTAPFEVVDGDRGVLHPVTIFDQRQLTQSVQFVQNQTADLGPIADAIQTSRNLER